MFAQRHLKTRQKISVLNNYVPYAFVAVFLEELGSIIILQMHH